MSRTEPRRTTEPGAGPGEIRVAVAGASGRMGRVALEAIEAAPDLVLAGAVARRFAEGTEGASSPLAAELVTRGIPVYADLATCLEEASPTVLVEFTSAAVAPSNLRTALERGVVPVSGTTGLSSQELAALAALTEERGVGAAVIPNFSLGAAVLAMLARRAAGYFGAAEIIEQHHDQKLDAPSGTALALARAVAGNLRRRAGKGPDQPAESLVAAGRDRGAGGPPPDPRGLSVDGVRVHSVRLSGLVAHHEIIFASEGETLALRHDSTSRSSFMPGLLLTVRHARALRGLVTSLEDILAMAGLTASSGG
ncbi:MAG: 4-hydroxy-tetrahydrodipicolinate reductase [Bacillota bacterium]